MIARTDANATRNYSESKCAPPILASDCDASAERGLIEAPAGWFRFHAFGRIVQESQYRRRSMRSAISVQQCYAAKLY